MGSRPELSNFCEDRRKIPLEEPDRLIEVSRGVLRRFFTEPRSTPRCTMICFAMPASGRFFFRSTKISPRPPAEKGCPCGGRLHCANYPRKPRGGPENLPRCLRLPAELLLRSRRLPQEGHAAIGAVPRPEGLPRRRGRLGRRHAARALAAASPRAFQALRRRPTDHRSLAGLLARALSADDRSGRSHRGRLVPAVEVAVLPRSLLEAFIRSDDDREGWKKLLLFLSPITITGGLRIEGER